MNQPPKFQLICGAPISPISPVLAPHGGVVLVVASLAERGQIQQAGGLGPMVKNMGAGQHHPAAGDRVGLVVFGTAPFAFIPCSIKPHEPAAQRPVFGVSGFIFRADGHCLDAS